MIFQRAPALVGQILKYSNINKEVRSRELQPALDLLTRAGLLGQIFATTASGLPLHAHLRDHRFKLQFLDVGLLQTACGVDAENFFSKEILQSNLQVKNCRQNNLPIKILLFFFGKKKREDKLKLIS